MDKEKIREITEVWLQHIRMETMHIDYVTRDVKEQLEKTSTSIKKYLSEISRVLK